MLGERFTGLIMTFIVNNSHKCRRWNKYVTDYIGNEPEKIELGMKVCYMKIMS